MNKGELASNFAMDFVFSDTGDLTFNEIYDELSNGNIPKECLVWQPFENFWADRLLQIIDDLANEFLLFYSVMKTKESE